MSEERKLILGALVAILIALLCWLGKLLWDKLVAAIKSWNARITAEQLSEAVKNTFERADLGMKNIEREISKINESQRVLTQRIDDRYSNQVIDQKFALRDERLEHLCEKIDDLKEVVNKRMDNLPDQLAAAMNRQRK